MSSWPALLVVLEFRVEVMEFTCNLRPHSGSQSRPAFIPQIGRVERVFLHTRCVYAWP